VLQVLLHSVIPEPGEENVPRIIVHAVCTFRPILLSFNLMRKFLNGNTDENQEASDASHAAPEFIEFFTSVMKNGDLARPVERYQCKLYAGFQRAIQI
jgi:hypothetical protein